MCAAICACSHSSAIVCMSSPCLPLGFPYAQACEMFMWFMYFVTGRASACASVGHAFLLHMSWDCAQIMVALLVHESHECHDW